MYSLKKSFQALSCYRCPTSKQRCVSGGGRNNTAVIFHRYGTIKKQTVMREICTVRIWIDGDACPKLIKVVLFRAAMRTRTEIIIVSNHIVSTPASPFIIKRVVGAGFDVADKYIVDNLQANDLVITADIVLADHVVAKKAMALNPRGELYTADNIKQILAMRNLNESLRDNGLLRGGAGKLSPKEVQNFSNNLDKIISKAARMSGQVPG